MSTPVSSYKPPSPPVQSLSQPEAAKVDKDDGNFSGAINGDSAIKPGGRGGISGDVFLDEADKAAKVEESGNKVDGDDLFE